MATEKMTDAALIQIIADVLKAAELSDSFDLAGALAAKIKSPVKTADQVETILGKYRTKKNGYRMNVIKRVLVLGGTVLSAIMKEAEALYKPEDHGLDGNATSFAAKVADGRIKGLDNAAAVLAAKAEVGTKTAKEAAIAKNKTALKTLGTGIAALTLDAKEKKAYSDALQVILKLQK